MREELAAGTPAAKNSNIMKQKQLSETDAEFIKDEFKKDIFERDWAKLYDILNHLKSLSNSLIVNEIIVP